MDNKSQHTLNVGKNVLEYLPPDSIYLDIPYILIDSKKLTKGKSYIIQNKTVRNAPHIAVKLLDFYDANGIVYLIVQELETNKTYTIYWYLDFNGGDYWLWNLKNEE